MPSIFNHDNSACWGIRRTSYNIFNEPMGFDVNVEKSVYRNEPDIQKETVKINTLHGPSNGYYGYHIPTNANTKSNDNCAMDTSTVVVHTTDETGINIDIDVNHNNNELWRRKRSHANDQFDSCKRSKTEEMGTDDMEGASFTDTNRMPSTPDTCNNDLPTYNFYRCTMSHYM